MATMAATVTAIRRMLNDSPTEDPLGAAVTDTTGVTITVTNIGLYSKGMVVETDDGADGAEQWYVKDVDTVNTQIAVKRGHNGSTAATHSVGVPILLKPRFPYDKVAHAVNFALDVDLYSNDVYERVEHAVTSSATTNTYAKPTALCLKPLALYQQTVATEDPLRVLGWSKRYYNIDTTLYSTGGYLTINGNYGVGGTDIYYLDCAHKLTIGTLAAGDERAVQTMACYYLLTWEDIRRTAGPVNQGDRSVRPLDSARLAAAFFKTEGERILRDRAAELKQTGYPSVKNFVRGGLH